MTLITTLLHKKSFENLDGNTIVEAICDFIDANYDEKFSIEYSVCGGILHVDGECIEGELKSLEINYSRDTYEDVVDARWLRRLIEENY